MASKEMRDELADDMELLDLCSSDEAQAVPTDKNAKNEIKDGIAKDPSPSFSEDWLPPELVVREFTTWPAHIDDNGVIYLYDSDLRHTRKLIHKELSVKFCVNFKDPAPEAISTKWIVGEPCVVVPSKYEAHRGRVLDVNQENKKCVIHYIDHAYVNECSFTKLRKAVPLRHIPPHSLRCNLNRIHPIGKTWDKETLNYLRKSIVGRKCFVKVLGDEVDGVLPIELRYESLWVNDYLVNIYRAEYQDNWIITKDKVSGTTDKFPTYRKYYGNKFICNVVEIHDVNTLPVHLIFDDENVFTLYEDMFEELQQEFMNMPPLDGVFENKACIALRSEDNQWYRASIEQFNETQGLVKIKYVDHGDTDVIPLDDIRETSQKWLFPPATLSVKLFGMQLNPNKAISVVAKHYAKVFLERFFLRGLFIVTVMDYEGATPLVEMRYTSRDWVQAKLVEHDILINRVVSVVRHSSLLKNNVGLTFLKRRKMMDQNY